jgi:2-polyprenyl-3-methyl-5-hydroxy-6-metoxy-1,4-benzoquinol methylase
MVKRDFAYTRKKSPFSSHEQILKLVKKSGNALELGSSNGFLTSALKEMKVDSVCVDVVPKESVANKLEKYERHDLENPSTLKFDKQFDYVIVADVLEHVRNADALLKHCNLLLKSNGRIIVSVPNIALWFYRLSLTMGRFNYGQKGTLDQTHVYMYTKDSIVRRLERAGFKINAVYGTGLPFEVVFESIGKSKFIKLMINKGEYDGKQVVPKEWIDEITYLHSHTKKPEKLKLEGGYGYLWWISDVNKDERLTKLNNNKKTNYLIKKQ